MKRLFDIIIIAASTLVMLAVPVSCTTDTESIKIKEPDVNKNQEKYFAQLREYRKTDHKVTMAWFGNIDVAISRAHHLKDIPDSIDIVSLLNPDDLPAWLVSEMDVVRNDKGMKVIYTIFYKDIENDYKAYAEGLGEDKEPMPLAEFIEGYMKPRVALCDKYGYDGMSVRYYGSSTVHMGEDEKEAYLGAQDAFMAPVKKWAGENPNKILVFEGTPEFVEDKMLLESCEYIVLDATEIRSAGGLTFRQQQAQSYDGVPADRFMMMVMPMSTNPADILTGSFTDASGNSARAITEAAKWVDTYEPGIEKKGLGIYGVQNDYYIKSQEYRYTRGAISIMNSFSQNR